MGPEGSPEASLRAPGRDEPGGFFPDTGMAEEARREAEEATKRLRHGKKNRARQMGILIGTVDRGLEIGKPSFESLRNRADLLRRGARRWHGMEHPQVDRLGSMCMSGTACCAVSPAKGVWGRKVWAITGPATAGGLIQGFFSRGKNLGDLCSSRDPGATRPWHFAHPTMKHFNAMI